MRFFFLLFVVGSDAVWFEAGEAFGFITVAATRMPAILYFPACSTPKYLAFWLPALLFIFLKHFLTKPAFITFFEDFKLFTCISFMVRHGFAIKARIQVSVSMAPQSILSSVFRCLLTDLLDSITHLNFLLVLGLSFLKPYLFFAANAIDYCHVY